MNWVKISILNILIFSFYELFILPQCNSKTDIEKKEQKNILLEIKTDHIHPPVVSDLYGMAISNIFDRINVGNSFFIKYDQQLNLRILRWPSGGESSYYHWNSKGYGYIKNEIESINKIAVDKFEKQGRFKMQSKLDKRYIDEFIELAKRTKSNVLIVANILTASPNELIDQLNFLKENGLKIVGVELGCEPYLNQLRKVFPSAEKYSSICIPYADSLRKYFPEIPIGACAAPYGKIYDDNDSNGLDNFFSNWNSVLKTKKWYDAIIVHYYLPFSCQNTQSSPQEIFNCAMEEMNENIDKYMSNSAAYYLKTFGADRKIWITEWNIAQGGTKGTYGNTLFQAMFIVEYFLKLNELNYEHNNLINIATYHNMDGGYIAAAAITNDHPDETYRDPVGDTLIRRSGFFAHLLIKEIYNQNQQKAEIIVKENNNIETDRNIHFEAYYTKATNETFIYFINKSGNSLNISNTLLNGKSIKNSSIRISYLSGDKTYASFGKTNFFKQYKIALPCFWQEEKTADAQLILPGYSVGYLKLNVN